MWVRAWAASSKETVSSVPAPFQASSGTNLIKQGEIVTGRPCGLVAWWSECSHGMREVLGSSPGRQAMCFFLPCDNCIYLAKIYTRIHLNALGLVRRPCLVFYPRLTILWGFRGIFLFRHIISLSSPYKKF